MISSVKICVAVDQFGGFAKENEIPWNIPEDFKHFMNTTRKSWCITGKNSYLEMVELKKKKQGAIYSPNVAVLNDRETFVVSSTLNPDDHNDCRIIHPDNIDALFDELNAREKELPLFVLGGQQLFELLLDKVDTVIMTHIPANFECDRFFPMDRLDSEFTMHKHEVLETSKYGNGVKLMTYIRI